MTETASVYLELEKVLLEIYKNTKLWSRRNELVGLIIDGFKEIKNVCDLCESEHSDYSIPSEWWNKLAENLRNKCLCFDCYMGKIGSGTDV